MGEGRGLVIGVIVLVVFAVCAFWLFEVGVTGNVALVEVVGFTCADGDGDLSFEDSLFVKSGVSRVDSESGSIVGSSDDRCNRFNSGKVREYYCDSSGEIMSITQSCKNGCLDGACIRDLIVDGGVDESSEIVEGVKSSTGNIVEIEGDVFSILENNQEVYDISLGNASWDSDGDNRTSGIEVCRLQGGRCLMVLLESKSEGLEPLTCVEEVVVDINEVLPNTLDIWCVKLVLSEE
jgi:hypothetical protein